MGARGLTIRDDLPAAELRRLARREQDLGGGADAGDRRRAEGMSRAEAARLAGMERQALRDAVVRYNAEGLAGLTAPGARVVGRGWTWRTGAAAPVGAGRAGGGGHRAERLDLAGAVPGGRRRWGVSLPPLAHGQADAPARPVTAEGAAVAPEGGSGGAGGVRKRGLQAALDAARGRAGKRLTLWFHGRSQIWPEGAHLPSLVRPRPAPTGPVRPALQLGAHLRRRRPANGDGFALVLPAGLDRAINDFLARFAATLAENEHAVMVLDSAGWHTANDLRVPANVTLVPAADLLARAEPGRTRLALPPRAPPQPQAPQRLRRDRRAALPSVERAHQGAPFAP